MLKVILKFSLFFSVKIFANGSVFSAVSPLNLYPGDDAYLRHTVSRLTTSSVTSVREHLHERDQVMLELTLENGEKAQFIPTRYE